MKYVLEGSIGVVAAVAIAVAGASTRPVIVGGISVGLLILVIEMLAWRRAQNTAPRR